MKKIILNSLYILFLFTSFIFSQTLRTGLARDTIHINVENSYKISSLNIIPLSEKIIVKGKQLSPNDYKFCYSKGTFSLSPNLAFTQSDTIFIFYETVRLNLKKEYSRRKLIFQYDDKLADTIRTVKKVSEPITAESIFGKDIQKSGAIIRGFTVGTNQDLQLNSGLRLQLMGKLSDEIDLIAALTDENTPIQPEGNTETLEELDKVFIELKHKNATGTFGDFELDLKDNEFSQIIRKLQGLKAEMNYGSAKGTVAIASSRGKFNTNQFYGIEGNQGPYRLNGINNERAIIIIAGSERVYIDGNLMKRGENNDYVIDYSNAEVTFTPKRLITSASRISIDFEYTDQNFRRNFLGADFTAKIFDEKLKVGIGYFREGDDENSPIELSLTDNVLSILRKAGDNRNSAVSSGVSLALPDSLGKVQGVYTKIDTLINLQPYSYYKFMPGSFSSVYNVSFSFVGEGNGDYLKESLGKYRFVGIKQGAYLPIIYLPLPEFKQLGNFSLFANLFEGINLSAELSGSDWDKNRFSSLDDADNFGYARKFLFEMTPREIKISGYSFGKAGIILKERFIQGGYTSLNRIDDVEFDRNYNVPPQVSEDQTLREFSLIYLPIQNLLFNTKYGNLKQGSSFSSDRILSRLNFGDKKNYGLDYNLDLVKSKNRTINSSWLRQNGKTFYSIGPFKPGIEFLFEEKEEKLSRITRDGSKKDSLLLSSLKYIEVAPFVDYNLLSFLDLKASSSFREESFPLNGILSKQSFAYTQQYQLLYRGVKEFSTTLNFTLRNKKITDAFKKKGFSDNQTVLLLSQSRFNFVNGFATGDFYYQAATEQSARLEKIFVKVPKGSGSYIYIGDINNNGIPDEDEFQLTAYDGDFIIVTVPTDKLFPVIDLKINTRWRIDFSRIMNGNNFWAKVLKPISTETFWRIEENSKETDSKKIYLLHFSQFMNDSTTIRGSQLFQNDLNLFQFSSEFSVRLRYIQRRSLNQFSGGIEKGYFRERALRIRFRMIEEINNQTDMSSQTDDMFSAVTTARARQIRRNDFSTDFSYRPLPSIEVGFKIEAGRSVDNYQKPPITVDMNSLALRVNFSFENIGRLRIETERTELISSSNSFNIPFEILRGNVIGKNYFLRAFFDYRISSFIQTSLSYDARLQEKSRAVQTMRAEARAYF